MKFVGISYIVIDALVGNLVCLLQSKAFCSSGEANERWGAYVYLNAGPTTVCSEHTYSVVQSVSHTCIIMI